MFIKRCGVRISAFTTRKREQTVIKKNVCKGISRSVLHIVVYCLYCYFRSIFIPRTCCSKSLLQVLEKLNIVVYRQSNYRNIKFSACNLKTLFHDKSSSTLMFIKGKTRDLQKLLRHLSGIVTYVMVIGRRLLEFQVVTVFLAFLLLFWCYTQMICNLKR